MSRRWRLLNYLTKRIDPAVDLQVGDVPAWDGTQFTPGPPAGGLPDLTPLEISSTGISSSSDATYSSDQIAKLRGASVEIQSLDSDINLTSDNGYVFLTADQGIVLSSNVGFFNKFPPVAQPAPIANATDTASTQARLNDLLGALRSLGIIDT